MEKKYLTQAILSLIVLQAIGYKLYSGVLFNLFIDFPNIAFEAYIAFLAVRAVNSFLILANHKAKRSVLQFIFLSLIELGVLVTCGILKMDSSNSLSDAGWLTLLTGQNFYTNLAIQLVVLVGAIVVYRSIKEEDRPMNNLVKAACYFLFPLIFFVSFLSTRHYSSISYCTALVGQNYEHANEDFINNSGVLNANPKEINGLEMIEFLPEKKYLVYYMDSDCKSCLRGVENIKPFENVDSIEKVFYLDIRFLNPEDAIYGQQLENLEISIGSSDILASIPFVPALFVIDNLKITNVFVKSMPTIYELSNMFPDLKLNL